MSPEVRERVRGRADRLCEYCLSSEDVTGLEFTVDHVIAKSRGGSDEDANLCLACFWCNCYKQARTEADDPETGRVVLVPANKLASLDPVAVVPLIAHTICCHSDDQAPALGIRDRQRPGISSEDGDR